VAALGLLVPASAMAQAPEPVAAAAHRPRICLALGGGGARGMAHIGVLRALERMQVPVHCIAGVSIGAIVGSLYALGMDIDGLEKVARETDWDAMFSDRPPRNELSFRRREDDLSRLVDFDIGFSGGEFRFPRGLIQGQNLQVFLRRLAKPRSMVKDFDRLPIPFRAVATNLEKGESVWLDHGELPRAVRASMAVPAIFAPVQVDGQLLVDGGLLANVPVEAARGMGADVVIAVDVGYPLRDRSGLDSAFDIADQTVTLMMRHGTKHQLALLGADDVLLVPGLADASSADFMRGDEFMDIGESAAEAAAGQLARYALSPQGYAQHLARRASHAPEETSPRVAAITVSNRSKMSEKAIEARISQRPGEALDLDALERDLQRVYGLGVFESVDYVLKAQQQDVVLQVNAREKSWGPNFLQMGILLENRFDGDADITIAARYNMTQVNKLGAEWRSDLRIGVDGLFRTEFYQPLSYGSPYFVAPSFELFDRTLEIYQDGVIAPLGEVRYITGQAGLALGKEIASDAEIRLGAEFGRAQRRIKVGDPLDPGLADRDFDIGQLYAQAGVDTLDKAPVPSDGTLARVQATLGREAAGASGDFERYELNYLSAWTFGRNTWYLGLDLGATESAEETSELFSLGGFLRLSGLNRNQLSGKQLALARVIYMRHLSMGGFGSLPFYFGTSLEYGGTWQEPDQVDWPDAIFAGSAFLMLDSIIGPIYLAGGMAEDHRYAVYLAIGRAF